MATIVQLPGTRQGPQPSSLKTGDPLEEMKRAGFAYHPLFVSDIMEDVFESFDQALEIAEAMHPAFCFDYRRYLYPRSEPDPDDGFIRRMGEWNPSGQAKYDEKWIFHFRPRLRALIGGRLGVIPTAMSEFLDLVEDLYFRAHDLHVQLAMALAERYPNRDIAARLVAGLQTNDSPLRLLRYDLLDPEEKPILGKEHIDRNGFTQHLGENFDGLILGNTPYVAREGMVGVFPGAKINYLSKGEIPGTPHSIKNTTPKGSTVHRKAAIFFGFLDCPELVLPNGEPDYWSCRKDEVTYLTP